MEDIRKMKLIAVSAAAVLNTIQQEINAEKDAAKENEIGMDDNDIFDIYTNALCLARAMHIDKILSQKNYSNEGKMAVLQQLHAGDAGYLQRIALDKSSTQKESLLIN